MSHKNRNPVNPTCPKRVAMGMGRESGHPEARQHALAAGADAVVSKALRAARARGGAGRAAANDSITEGSDG